MFDQLTRYTDVPARALMAAIFILSGLGKISAFAATQGYMEAFGLPGALLLPTIAFELGAGFALLVGFQVRLIALLLTGFSLVSAVIFHANFGDQMQQINFLKNLAMAGGFLILAKNGAPGFSVDQWLSSRRHTTSSI
ncbi:MAG: DoxX family protein [Robiginitomaculum sp.]|nr:DoxX family protein [Robiginitomaculum sp.]MDQ7076724.1 DoxX family protein [Robiginitomaculum sp.]